MTAEHKKQDLNAHILSSYLDASGVVRSIGEETLSQLRSALSTPMQDACQALPLEPVYVCQSAPVLVLHFNPLCLKENNYKLNYQIRCENGQCIEGAVGIDPTTGAWTINKIIPLGYHDLTVNYIYDSYKSSIIVSPGGCYNLPNYQKKKLWGLCLQLYTVRSQRNWGIGDFTDLENLVAYFADRGADFVGLNPLHALYPTYPEHVSPYSPSSRQWLNVAYIDVDAVVAEQGSATLHKKIQAANFTRKLDALRTSDWVMYEEVIPLKIEILQKVFQEGFFSQDKILRESFLQFTTHGGHALRQQAGFDALQSYFHRQGLVAWGWPVWPDDYKSYSATEVQVWMDEHPEDIEFYIYLQWVAEQQLKKIQKLAKQKKMKIGLYRDLAVGSAQGSAEVWGNKKLYCQALNIGAPPDPLGPQGQSWGLPPMNPTCLKQQKYQPFIDLVRSNMRNSGALRIDHVMGLLRLWLIPNDTTAKNGAYVKYPIDDFMHILSLESHRHQCLIIGEDLGTLPEGFQERLQDAQVYSYRVFLFERAKDGGYFSPEHYPKTALTVVATHDMPTLKGWWHCDDLALGKELGIYQDEAALHALYTERHEAKQQILNSLEGHQCLPDTIARDVTWAAMTPDLCRAIHQHIAGCASTLVGIQLEDWLYMDTPVNVPGTSNEYPNWRRKLSRNLEDIIACSQIDALAQVMTQGRKNIYGDSQE